MRKAPFRRINPNLVKRLKGLFAKDSLKKNPQVANFLIRLKNIDPRPWKESRKETTFSFGYRVRSLNVSRKYPGMSEIVVKRVHNASAQELINIIS